MENASPQSTNNPFQEVCVYLSQSGNNLAIAELIKRFGFTVYAFVSLARMARHLEANPMTAAVFVQGSLDELGPRVRNSYHGPLYELSMEPDALLNTLGEHLREVHRNQMKVQDPKVLRVLKAVDAFTQGSQKTLLLLGSEGALQRAKEFVEIFLPSGLTAVGDDLPEEVPASGAFVTQDLFGRDLAWQQRWNVLFGTAELPHLILEPRDSDALDALYLKGSLDEMLYERLSFRQTNAEPLADYSVEELAVQPLQKSDPRLIFDAEGDVTPAPEVSTASKKGKGSRSGLLGRFLKR